MQEPISDYSSTKEAQDKEHLHQKEMQEKLLAENARLSEVAHTRRVRNIWLTSVLSMIAPILVAVITLLGARSNPYTGIAEAFGEGMKEIAQAIRKGSLDSNLPPKPAPAQPSGTPLPVQPTPSTPTVAERIDSPTPSELISSNDPECSGLDSKIWKITLGPVGRLRLPDGFGYSVLLHLENMSDLTEILDVQNGASITDDLGNTAVVSSPTLIRGLGVKVSPRTIASAQFTSAQVPAIGSSIQSLSVPIQIMSFDSEGRGKGSALNGLTCSSLRVGAVARDQ